MARTKNWEVKVHGVKYNVEVYKKTFSRGLRVNGREVQLENSKTFGATSETHFLLGSKPAILVINGTKVDLALDGTYMDSGEKYVSVGSIPKWGWIFVVLNALVAVGFGPIPFLLAFLGVTYSLRTSISAKITLIPKILICVLITVVNYMLFFNIFTISLVARGNV